VHLDGDSIEYRMRDFLKKNTATGLALLIAQAQSKGGMRSFHSPGLDEKELTTDFLDGNEPYVIDETNWEDQERRIGAPYSYLVDYETEQIMAWSKY
jgi:hypothetical protein